MIGTGGTWSAPRLAWNCQPENPTERRIDERSKEAFMRSMPWMLLVLCMPCPGFVPADDTREPGSRDLNSTRRPVERIAFEPVDRGRAKAHWVGQDGQDWTGPGPSVGPDGLQDVHIRLDGLAAGLAIKAIRIEAPGPVRWESGTNPRLFRNAELICDARIPGRGDLYLQPDRDVAGVRLRVLIAYDQDKTESTTLVAGRCDAGLRMPAARLPETIDLATKVDWLGQDGAEPGMRGDVHVVIYGVPAPLAFVGSVLTDAVRGTWIQRENDRVAIPVEVSAMPLKIKRGPDGKTMDLFFRPYRDESRETMTLRLIAADGRNMLVRFPGGPCDLGKLAPRPSPSRIDARPGDNLQALVDHYGTVRLTKGTYRLSAPLVLEQPVRLTSEGGATILFDQAESEPPWSSAIKVHAGNTTLDGFAVRFAGPVRWNEEISWGPAVIGVTDNIDPPHDEHKENLVFTHLDLEIPPVGNNAGWTAAVRLMRLIRAKSGVIAGNVLRGGPIEFFEGPWRVVDNDYRGTVPGTFSPGVFTGHGTYDLILRDNRARDVGASGKTWRFLVLTWQGFGDVVERNLSEGLGALEGDTIPWSNFPEIILTESYHVRYEGRVMGLSADGRLLQTGRAQEFPGRTGDVVSLLAGPAAGEWRRIVQALDTVTYLVDRPIPAGTTVVSITAGFIGERFESNRIDIRGGRKSSGFVFVGNHFGTRIVNNELLGGEGAFKLTACPTEAPMMWGWTHAPFLGGVIEGNTFEDAERGGTLGVEHDPRSVKSNEGRTYMTVRLDKNVVRWSAPFLRRLRRDKIAPGGVVIGYTPSSDPGELVVRASQNRLEAPTAELYVPSLVVHGARYNAKMLVNRQFRLPTATPDTPVAGPDARR
jgi:hypothetical protein